MRLSTIQKLLSLQVDYTDKREKLVRLVIPMFLALGYNTFDKRSFVIKDNLDILVYKDIQVVLRVTIHDGNKVDLGSGLTCHTNGQIYNVYLDKKLKYSFDALKATEEDFQEFKNRLGYENIVAYWDRAELEVLYGGQANHIGELENKAPKTKKAKEKATKNLVDKPSKVTSGVQLMLNNLMKFDGTGKASENEIDDSEVTAGFENDASIDTVDHLIMYQVLQSVKQQASCLTGINDRLVKLEEKLDKLNETDKSEPEKNVKQAAEKPEKTDKTDKTDKIVEKAAEKPVKTVEKPEKPVEKTEAIKTVEKPAESTEIKVEETIKKETADIKNEIKATKVEKPDLDLTKEYIYNKVSIKGYRFEYIKIRGEKFSNNINTAKAVDTLVEYILDNKLCTVDELVDKVKSIHVASDGYYTRSHYIDKYNIVVSRIDTNGRFRSVISSLIKAARMSDSDVLVKFKEQA